MVMHCPLARSALGSTSGGAAEQSEAEGVRFVGWDKSMISAAPVGEALSLPPAAKPLGSPNWRPLQTQKLLAYSNQRTTPPQSARSGCQLPQRWSQGGCAAAGGFEPPLRVRWKPGGWRGAKLATPTNSNILGDFHSTNRFVASASGGYEPPLRTQKILLLYNQCYEIVVFPAG